MHSKHQIHPLKPCRSTTPRKQDNSAVTVIPGFQTEMATKGKTYGLHFKFLKHKTLKTKACLHWCVFVLKCLTFSLRFRTISVHTTQLKTHVWIDALLLRWRILIRALSGRMGTLPIHIYGYNYEHYVIVYTFVKDTQSQAIVFKSLSFGPFTMKFSN